MIWLVFRCVLVRAVILIVVTFRMGVNGHADCCDISDGGGEFVRAVWRDRVEGRV